MILEVLLLFLTLHSLVLATPTNDRNCLYMEVSNEFSACVRNNSNRLNLDLVMANLMEYDFTGEELLLYISATCRNEHLLQTYSTCTNRAVDGCPQVASGVTNAVNEGISVFCGNGSTSAWLNEVLHDGFLHKKKCTEDKLDNEVLGMVIDCLEGFRIDREGETVDTAISTIETLMQRWVGCMIERAPLLSDQDGDGVLDCGSTWQDVVLAYALRFSSLEQLGVKLNEEVKNELKAIKLG